MPWGDGTGPWWAQGRGWRCWRALGYRPAYGIRYWFYPAVSQAEPVALKKEEQIKILEAELREIEAERKAIESKLKELKQ